MMGEHRSEIVVVAALVAAMHLARAADTNAPADFSVLTHVVAPNPQRYGVNLREPSELNNFTLDPSFEPTVIRRMHIATGGGTNWIENRPFNGPPTWSPGTWHFQSMADGFFDTATVRVYRLSATAGPAQLVRSGVITNYVTDGFRRLHAAPVSTNRFTDTNVLAGMSYEYQLRAVDRTGNVSSNWNGENVVTSTPLAGVAAAVSNTFWTGTHYTSGDNVRPAFPAGLTAVPLAGAVQLSWTTNSETDLAGYYVYRRANGTNDQWRVYLDGSGAAIQTGDFYFIDSTWPMPPVHRMHDRLGNNRFNDPWRFICGPSWPYGLPGAAVRDTAAVCPTNGGQCSLRLENPGTHEARIHQPRFSSPDYYGGFYPNLDPGKRYRMEVWLKQSGGLTNQVRFWLTQHYSNVVAGFTVTTNWQKFSHTFLAGALPTNANISELVLGYFGPGTIWVDNLLLYEDDDNDPATYPAYAIRPAALQALIDYRPGVLRLNTGASTGYWGTDLDDWTREEPEVGMQWHSDQGKHIPDDPYKLPTALRMTRDCGGEPWLIVGSFFSEQEWLGLMEYLAAPYDPTNDTPVSKPYAHRRYVQGQTAPWTEVFPKIHFEFGCELWNPVFVWNFANGSQNGQFARHFYEVAQSSPYFTTSVAARLNFLVDGWMIQPDATNSFGHTASLIATNAQGNTVATYIGGWEAGVALGGTNVNDDGFQDYMMYSPQVIFNFVNQHAASRDANAAAGHEYNVALYEGGPGYANPSPGMPYEPISEEYGKSLAAGVATLDTYLYDSYLRIEPQAFFTFGGQYNWASHSFIARGYHPHTAWLGLQMRNRYVTGAMLATALHSGPTLDVAARTNASGGSLAPATANVPLIQPYAFRDGDKYSVFVLSRRINGATPVTMRLPFTSVTNATLHMLTGDPRTGNSTSLNIAVQSAPVASFAQNFTFSMPPGSVYLYVFEGTSTPTPPARPRVYVSRAPGQTAATTVPSARFAVQFSEPVHGFTNTDIIIGGTAGATQLSIAQNEPRNGMSYTITVTALATNGTVTVRLPAGVVTSVGTGHGNLESINLDGGVNYTIAPPMNQVLAYENFGLAPANAPNPPFLHGVTSGTGWAGAWSVQNFVATNYPDGYKLATNAPLAFSNLYMSGSHAVGGRNFDVAGRLLDLAGALAPWRTGVSVTNPVGLTGTELWMSVLLRKDTADDNHAAVGFHNSSSVGIAIGNSKLVVGYLGAICNSNGVRYWSVLVRNDADTSLMAFRSDAPVVVGEPALLVLRMRFGAQDRFDLFVNPPSLGGSAPAAPNVAWTTSGSNDIVFRALTIAGGGNTNTFSADEIRLGDSYAAVTPVRLAGSVQFTAPSFTAGESDGAAHLYVSRLGGVSGSVSVAYTTAVGTADTGDFAATTGLVFWADGDGATKVLSVPLFGDATIESDETFGVTLGGLSGAGWGALTAATVTIANDDFTPFDAWRNLRFTATELTNPVVGGARGDPDGDGLANLAEYALGLDPLVAGTNGLPWCEMTATEPPFFTLGASRNPHATDIGLVVETSSNLVDWLSGPAHTTTLDDTPTLLRVRENSPAISNSLRYLRLRIVQP